VTRHEAALGIYVEEVAERCAIMECEIEQAALRETRPKANNKGALRNWKRQQRRPSNKNRCGEKLQ
jgi:hypothetical protein